MDKDKETSPIVTDVRSLVRMGCRHCGNEYLFRTRPVDNPLCCGYPLELVAGNNNPQTEKDPL